MNDPKALRPGRCVSHSHIYYYKWLNYSYVRMSKTSPCTPMSVSNPVFFANRQTALSGWACGEAKVLRCPAGPRHAGAPARSWRTDAGALAQLGTRSGGAPGLSAALHFPLELAEISRSALQLLCHRQVQHTKPITTSAHQDWTTTNEHSAACTQRAARARTHAPPAPRSQGTLP